MDRPKQILPVIVFSQFAGTSLWFAGNAVLPDIQESLSLGSSSLGWMISAVQLGFITGTFLFSVFSVADRYSPRLVFLICCSLGALSNYMILVFDGSFMNIITLRYFTGFFLAGIYPVGMKIAAGWYQKGLGRALGYLVGALILGTAFPFMLRGLGKDLPWEYVLISVSILAGIGGVSMFAFVKNGPYHSKSAKFEWSAIHSIFKVKEFRRAAFGYFGHMWELYALYAFVPFIVTYYAESQGVIINVSMSSFFIIGAGALGCAAGGIYSMRIGSARVASFFLFISGFCCLISPFIFDFPPVLFFLVLGVWGFSVVADSPQFSTLNALLAPKQWVGTGLTIVTSIGFAISILSIELLNYLKEILPPQYLFVFLLPGPILGLIAIRSLIGNKATNKSRK